MKLNLVIFFSIAIFISSCVPQAGSTKKKKKSGEDESALTETSGGAGQTNSVSDPYGFNNNIGSVSINNNRVEASAQGSRATVNQGQTANISTDNYLPCERGVSIDPATDRCASSATISNNNVLACASGMIQRDNVCVSINNSGVQVTTNQSPSFTDAGNRFFQNGMDTQEGSLKQICQGPVPSNSMLCNPSTLGQGPMITNFLGSNCSSSSKCEYTCKFGYLKNNSSGKCEVLVSDNSEDENGNPSDNSGGLSSLGSSGSSFFDPEEDGDVAADEIGNEGSASDQIMGKDMNIVFSKDKPSLSSASYFFREAQEVNTGDMVYGRVMFATKKVKVCLEKISPDEAAQGQDFTQVDGTCSQEKAGAYNSSVTSKNEGGFAILDPSISISQDANSAIAGKWILTQNTSSGLDEWVLIRGNKIDEAGHYQATFVTYGNDNSKYIKYSKKRLFVQVQDSQDAQLFSNAYALPMSLKFSKDKPYYKNYSYFFRDYVTAKVGERLYGRILNGTQKMKACIDYLSEADLSNGKTFPSTGSKCNKEEAGDFDKSSSGEFRVLDSNLSVAQDAANPSADWVYISDKKEWIVVRGLVSNDAGKYRVTYVSYNDNNKALDFVETIIPINPLSGTLATGSASLPTVDFRRFHSENLSDHVSVATNQYDSFLNSNGYTLEATIKLFSPDLTSAQKVGMAGLYLCRQGSNNYMISKESNCEGQITITSAPFAYVSISNNGGKALYRCRMKGSVLDHFVTTIQNCEGQIQEGRLGYVPVD